MLLPPFHVGNQYSFKYVVDKYVILILCIGGHFLDFISQIDFDVIIEVI